MDHSNVDDPTRRLTSLMYRLHRVTGPSAEDLVGIEVPPHQLRALFVVAEHGPVSVGQLAEGIGASLASTSSLADRLVRSGHLRRDGDPDDRRRVLLAATDQGRQVTWQLMARFNERFGQLVTAMHPEAVAALEVGLTDLLRAAEELGLRHDDHPHGGHP